jgi:plastocyanin
MRVRKLRVAIVAAMVVASMASSASAATLIRGNSMRWRPATVSIARGGRVRWKAVDVHHTVHSYGSNWSFSKDLPTGTTTSHRFRRRGTFRFYCTIHGSVSGGVCTGMCGKVVVG